MVFQPPSYNPLIFPLQASAPVNHVVMEDEMQEPIVPISMEIEAEHYSPTHENTITINWEMLK